MTAWTDFVRKWATENKVSFKEALKSEKMRADYRKVNPKIPKTRLQPHLVSGLTNKANELKDENATFEIEFNEKPKKKKLKRRKPAIVMPPQEEETKSNINNILQDEVPTLKEVVAEAKVLDEIYDVSKTPAVEESVEGKGLKVKDVKGLLKKSYAKKMGDVDGWKLDPSISTKEAQVYKDPETGKVAVVHRGTASLADWGTNLAQMAGITTDRMKRARDIQRKAESKYGKENITTLGHSAGARWAEKYGDKTAEVLTLNKPVLPLDLLGSSKSHHPMQTDIMSAYDPVSILRDLQRGTKRVDIASKTYNPLLEHSTKVLNRLPEEQIIGIGLSHKQDLENYGMMLKHLISHIADPNEPIDPKDYAQSKIIIDAIKGLKEGIRGGGNPVGDLKPIDENEEYDDSDSSGSSDDSEYSEEEWLAKDYGLLLKAQDKIMEDILEAYNKMTRLHKRGVDTSQIKEIFDALEEEKYRLIERAKNHPYNEFSSSNMEKKEELDKIDNYSNKIDKMNEAKSNINNIKKGKGISADDYKLQSVAFPRDKWTPAMAKKWLKDNKHKMGKMDTTESQYRFRQEDPKKVEKAGFTDYRTKMIGDKGIQLILAYKK